MYFGGGIEMINKNKITAVLIILIACITFLVGCSNSKNVEEVSDVPVSKTEFVLGTVATIKIFDSHNATEEVFNKAFERLREIENKMTINDEESEVIDINKNAGKEFVKVSDDTFYVISKGKHFSELTNGRFDISVGPLVKLWNIGTEYAAVPSEDEINIKKELVDYNDVILDKNRKAVMLNKENMMVDLGGIAKGYGADEVVKILKDNNVKHAIINLGGNVFAYGNKEDDIPWSIGVQNPYLARGGYIGIVKVSHKTVVTSGVYERYFEKYGKRYHHILDPDTGYPVENKLIGISIVADSSIDADSLSTSAFALGVDKGIELIEKLDNAEAIFITEDSEVYMTSGLKDRFKLTDSNFNLMN